MKTSGKPPFEAVRISPFGRNRQLHACFMAMMTETVAVKGPRRRERHHVCIAYTKAKILGVYS